MASISRADIPLAMRRALLATSALSLGLAATAKPTLATPIWEFQFDNFIYEFRRTDPLAGDSLTGLAPINTEYGSDIWVDSNGDLKIYEPFNRRLNTFDKDTLIQTIDIVNLGDPVWVPVTGKIDRITDQSGKNIIRKDSNGVIRIGENSLLTIEEGGRQKLWATDANDNAIDIDITDGSDLKINGKSVQGQIDQNQEGINKNRADINKNRADINKNRENINSLGDGVAASTALTSALSALPTAAIDSPFSCGVGTGGYSSRFAMGIGCAAKINKRLSVNAGGSHVFGGSANYGGGSLDTFAARAGFVFKLGKIDSPAATNEQLQSQLDEVKQENALIKAKYSTIEGQNKALMARLERLEAIALGQKPVTTTANLK